MSPCVSCPDPGGAALKGRWKQQNLSLFCTRMMPAVNMIVSRGSAGEQPPAWDGALLMAGWITKPQSAQITHWQCWFTSVYHVVSRIVFHLQFIFQMGFLSVAITLLFMWLCHWPCSSHVFWHLKAGNWEYINPNSSLGTHACRHNFWNKFFSLCSLNERWFPYPFQFMLLMNSLYNLKYTKILSKLE